LNDKNTLLPVKSDFVFKLIFGDQRNVDILADFLKSVLDIPDEEYDRITVVDPHIKKESADDKYGILDVKIHTKGGLVVQVEIQVEPIHDMKQRTIYGQSKMITEQMSSGKNWSVIKRVVSIIITDFTLVAESDKYHNQFHQRTADGIQFTDLTEINTLELNKLPTSTDKTDLWYWMEFIKSKGGENMEMLAERSPQMRKAVGVLKELSADERTRMLFEEREKARRDIASRMGGARREGIQIGRQEREMEIARKLLSRNRPIEEIIEDTGLTRDEIESL
jgi:predicted transposase/invertase (TIGR01784 family)